MTELKGDRDASQKGMTEPKGDQDTSQPKDDRKTSLKGLTESKPVNEVELVIKFVSHVFGASILMLSFAMGQVGIGQYLIVLVMELYFTGNSLKFFCEMAPHEHGIDHTNYFVIVERLMTKNHKDLVHYMLRIIFILDAVVCTAFYLETAFELIFPCMTESTSPHLRSGYRTCTFVSFSFFLFIFEIGSEFVAKLVEKLGVPSELNTNFNVQNSTIEQFHVTLDDKSKDDKTSDINMQAVVQRLHGFSWKRCIQLLLIFFLIYSQFEITRDMRNDEIIRTLNMSQQCPGLLKPFFWDELNTQIFHVIPIIIFSLMHYAIFLPICLEELRLPEPQYSRLVNKASLLLLVILSVIPLVVHAALGGSAPVLFTTAYGCTFDGKMMTVSALAISLNAMLLRIIPCCRLIQVLFDWESDSHFLVIKICLLAASFLLASTIQSVLHLATIAGICSIVLIIIIPRVTYIRFKLLPKDSCINFNIIQIGLCVVGHVLLLPPIVATLIFADSNVGQYCHEFFNEYAI